MSRLAVYLDFVKFSHTVFALPFGLIAMLVAAGGLPAWWDVAWIVAAMVCARTAAMTFNRIADRAIDAKNPRTAARHLPAGIVGAAEAWGLLVTSTIGFLISAAMLSWLCLALAPVVLGILLGYSYTKRFTSLSHLVLGLALACAPMGVYVALLGTLPWEAVVLGLAVLTWVAGFDIIYACQDESFDRREGLHSMVVALGVSGALWLSRGMHAITAGALVAYGEMAGLGVAYGVGVAGVALVLVVEQSLVSPRDLSRVNMAFFTVNGCVGIVLFVCTVVDLAIGLRA